jgi:tetratricopeptide (TPR) repeat protein
MYGKYGTFSKTIVLRRTLNNMNLVLIAACTTFMVGPIRSALAASLEESREQFKTGRYAECLESARKAVKDGKYQVEWRILMIESQTALGQYDKAADDMDVALLNYPVSIRLLELGNSVYAHNGQADRAAETLGRVYRIGTARDIRFLSSLDIVALGKSLLLLGGEPRLVLDEFFTRAIRNDPNCREAYLAAGSLAMAKQDYELAANQYRKALERFGDDPDMHCGLARAFYQNDRKAMIESLDAALHVNPRHGAALTLLAEHQIDCEDYEAATASLDRVHSVNPWHPQAWAYRAVLAHLANEPNTVDSSRINALKFWPNNPTVDYLIGRKLSQNYRFAEGAACQRRALKLDPKYLPAKIQLAQDLLRLGDEQEGWTLANEVHARDAYNVEAYNLTSLHDNLSKFKTLRVDGFIIRMDELEAAVYGDEVVELLQQAKSELCKKYDLELDRPVTVELFPNQQDFAVRTFGLPGVEGFLGVCFGNVVTANSPKADRPSNWKSLLWHEFCHVVTLNLTHNRMPRWLSEGISVYEELQRDSTWGQRMSPQYRSMILAGELTPVGDLSAAFLDPSSAEHLQFAYYESSLVVEFLVERFGLEALKAVLGDLEKGDQINSAISRRAAPIKQIEEQFKVFARKRAEDLAQDEDWGQRKTEHGDPADRPAPAEWLAQHPNNFQALTMYAKTLLANRKWEEAKEPLKKLIALYPQYAGDDNAYRLLAEAHRNLGETEQERGVLDKLAMISSDATYAYERLMEIAAEKKDWPEVVKNGEKYMAVVPLLTGLHRRLGLAYEELGRAEQAIRSYRRLLLLDPADPADVNYRIGRLLEHTDRVAAKRHVLLALAEAPRFRQAHRLLLKIINADREQQEHKSPADPVGAQNELPAVQEDVP